MNRVSRRKFLGLAAGATGIAWAAWGGPMNGLHRARRDGWALGANVSVLALHARQATARNATEAAFAELGRIEQVLSLYRPQSQLVRLNRQGVLEDPDDLLATALQYSAEMSHRSSGAFDATVQPLWDAYFRAAERAARPAEADLERARRLVGWQNVEVSSERIRLARPGMGVTLNGIAQGLAADRVLAVLRDYGIEHALVNTGEIGSLGHKSPDGPWTAGVQHPRRADAYIALAALDGRCMATSGDYETRFGEGFENHHIFDPATGHSPAAFSSVTVLAPLGIEADALSTAVFVLGPEKGLRLVLASAGADALLVFKDGRTLRTGGFPGMDSGGTTT